MTKHKNNQFTWEEMEDQIRDAIIAQASVIELSGPDGLEMTEAFLGFKPTDTTIEDFDPDEKLKTDIRRHRIYGLCWVAYQYLYQLEGRHEADADVAHEVGCCLLSGAYPQADSQGEPSPLCRMNNPPLRRMLEAFYARWGIESGDWGANIRDMSYLSGLSEPSVRASLSKEGYRLEQGDHDDTMRLDAANALKWLQNRRGFVPSREDTSPENLRVLSGRIADSDRPFAERLAELTSLHGISLDDLAERTGTDRDWLGRLGEGEKVDIDIDALSAIGKEFGLQPRFFVPRAIEYLLGDE